MWITLMHSLDAVSQMCSVLSKPTDATRRPSGKTASSVAAAACLPSSRFRLSGHSMQYVPLESPPVHLSWLRHLLGENLLNATDLLLLPRLIGVLHSRYVQQAFDVVGTFT